MGYYAHYEDSELDNLPPEAWENTFDVDGPFEASNDWIAQAPKEHQRIAMREWFLARYCDPAMELMPFELLPTDEFSVEEMAEHLGLSCEQVMQREQAETREMSAISSAPPLEWF